MVDTLSKGLFNIVFRNTRAVIDGLTIDATLRELHESNCTITDNPIENGSNASDNVVLEPKVVTLEGVITDTPLSVSFVGDYDALTRVFGKSSRSKDGYDRLLQSQAKREPFDLITGLKKYSNMLIAELSVQRDKDTGKAVHFTAKLREVIIVKSKEIEIKPSPTSAPIASETKDVGKSATEKVPEGKPSVLRNLWRTITGK